MGGMPMGSMQMGGAGNRNMQMGGMMRGTPAGMGMRGTPQAGMNNMGRMNMGNMGMRQGAMNPGSFRSAMDGAGNRGMGDRPSNGDLGKFLGLPSDGGFHSPATAGMARTSGGEGMAARRAQDGAYGSGVRDQRGLGMNSRDEMWGRAAAVRNDFRPGDFYSDGWFRRYPGAWNAGRWAYGGYWAAADWGMLSGWFGYGMNAGIPYNYGNNIVYQDNSVYMNGQSLGSASDYYDQVQQQAVSGSGDVADATAKDSNTEWMPLGVFAMSHEQQTKANLVLQLAINRDGVVRGNYTATMADHNKPVKGSLDRKTQRVAWTIGDDTTRIFEAGLYDLTKDDVPMLIHFGSDRTEQWHLIRLNDQDTGSESSKPPQK
jgi:hypothetical protein